MTDENSTAAAGGGYRIEHDSMGEVRVPADAKWRAQTQRAVENFPISGQRLERAHIDALAQIKAAAAKVNADLKVLDPEIAEARQEAAAEEAEAVHQHGGDQGSGHADGEAGQGAPEDRLREVAPEQAGVRREGPGDARGRGQDRRRHAQAADHELPDEEEGGAEDRRQVTAAMDDVSSWGCVGVSAGLYGKRFRGR